jgi:SNF2 family DNA or RNA helicase
LVELDSQDRKVYHDIITEMIAELDSGQIVATPTVIAQYTRLKQVCISRELLGSNRENVHSAKLDALSELIESAIPNHKIVMFTTQLEALKMVKDRIFRDHGIIPLEISGDVKTVDRQHNVDRFMNDPNARLFLITVKSGGVGLNLTSADICVHLDKHPNPQVNNQAEDRLYRIGQKKNVTVYSILAKNTLEEYIENMLLKKEIQFNSIIDGELKFVTKYLDTLMRRWN